MRLFPLWMNKLVESIDALYASPAADNTIVVLVSDHGFHLGEHGNPGPWGKKTNFDKATKIPFSIDVPDWYKVENGKLDHMGLGLSSNTRAVASIIDIFPTVAEIAGISDEPVRASTVVSGVSLIPIMEDPLHGYVRAAAVTQYKSWVTPALMSYSVRTLNHRMTLWVEAGSGTTWRYIARTSPDRMWWDYTENPEFEKRNFYRTSTHKITIRGELLRLWLDNASRAWKGLNGQVPPDFNETVIEKTSSPTSAPTLILKYPDHPRSCALYHRRRRPCLEYLGCRYNKRKKRCIALKIPRTFQPTPAPTAPTVPKLRPTGGDCRVVKNRNKCNRFYLCRWRRRRCRNITV